MNYHEPIEMSTIYLDSLVELMNALKKEKVEVKKFICLNSGIELTFKGLDGDAVCHNFSYGNEVGLWETYGMPWDYGDVSTHNPEDLAKLLGALKRGDSWEHLNL